MIRSKEDASDCKWLGLAKKEQFDTSGRPHPSLLVMTCACPNKQGGSPRGVVTTLDVCQFCPSSDYSPSERG